MRLFSLSTVLQACEQADHLPAIQRGPAQNALM
jgi:hypothetical protein